MGDFNAKNSLWGSPSSDVRGKEIEKLLEDTNLVVLNDGSPTHVGYYGFSHIDLTLASPNIANKGTWYTGPSCNSDHFMLFTELQIGSNAKADYLPKFNFKKADWNKFSRLCDQNLITLDFDSDIDTICTNITSAIVTAAESSIPKTKSSRKHFTNIFWNGDCKEAVQKRNAALSKFKKSKSYNDFIEYKKSKALVNLTIKKAKREM